MTHEASAQIRQRRTRYILHFHTIKFIIFFPIPAFLPKAKNLGCGLEVRQMVVGSRQGLRRRYTIQVQGCTISVQLTQKIFQCKLKNFKNSGRGPEPRRGEKGSQNLFYVLNFQLYVERFCPQYEKVHEGKAGSFYCPPCT